LPDGGEFPGFSYPWEPRQKAYLNQLCGAPKAHRENVHASLYPPHQSFSKKVENLAHAVSLHFMYYNFGRIHKTLKVAPAMEAGISDHVWSLEEIAGLTD
jgi:hypothetical protein